MMRLSRMPTAKYLMLKEAYHRPMSSPCMGSARSLGTDELKHCHRDKQRGETIEELGNDEPQVGVVNWVIVLLTIPNF